MTTYALEPSYLYNGNPIPEKTVFILRRVPGSLGCNVNMNPGIDHVELTSPYVPGARMSTVFPGFLSTDENKGMFMSHQMIVSKE